ncbi:hypothetical protein [Burkholderia cepacia]|uniref:hypothetical protein n=1 Tax=Burkholderia cepacia TaxID=292 RepID=UPI001C96A59E|nr:hypothetical protein [Burkholderia cepacia]MBY4803060.1 hypothetical protein [Burkholderia cepacia]MCA8333738.1 hypothetical protein [Burkholderia cepacia]
MTTSTNETRLRVGGRLHAYALPSGQGGAIIRYNATGDYRDRRDTRVYRGVSLTRATPDGPETRDFFVLDALQEGGQVIVRGQTDEEALTETLAAPDRFWKSAP